MCVLFNCFFWEGVGPQKSLSKKEGGVLIDCRGLSRGKEVELTLWRFHLGQRNAHEVWGNPALNSDRDTCVSFGTQSVQPLSMLRPLLLPFVIALIRY